MTFPLWLVTWSSMIAALTATAWAALLALAEETAVGDAVHALGDAPTLAAGGRVPLHRALHVARLALLALAGVAAGRAVGWWEDPWSSALWHLAVTALLLFILGDALPRSFARVAPEIADAALPIARRTLVPFRPLIALLSWIDRSLHRTLRAGELLRPDLGVAQRDMLLGVFTLADTTVEEVMTPRLDMAGVDLGGSAQDTLDAFRSSEHTRLPVYDGTPDNIVGLVYAKDLVPLAMGIAEPHQRWQDLVRPAAFVPETKTLDSQLRDFQRGPAHLALVVDEFGGTAGLVTLEDVLEEIVGEIRDEHDVEAGAAIRQDGDRYFVDGRVTLDDLSAALGQSFSHPQVSTVGGLVYSILGRVPRSGEELTLDGFRVVVESVERRRVTRVSFERR